MKTRRLPIVASSLFVVLVVLSISVNWTEVPTPTGKLVIVSAHFTEVSAWDAELACNTCDLSSLNCMESDTKVCFIEGAHCGIPEGGEPNFNGACDDEYSDDDDDSDDDGEVNPPSDPNDCQGKTPWQCFCLMYPGFPGC